MVCSTQPYGNDVKIFERAEERTGDGRRDANAKASASRAGLFAGTSYRTRRFRRLRPHRPCAPVSFTPGIFTGSSISIASDSSLVSALPVTVARAHLLRAHAPIHLDLAAAGDLDVFGAAVQNVQSLHIERNTRGLRVVR